MNIVGWREPPFAGASPYWIVRNSWGSSWGADGYMQLLMDKTAGSEGLCRSHKHSYYPNTSV